MGSVARLTLAFAASLLVVACSATPGSTGASADPGTSASPTPSASACPTALPATAPTPATAPCAPAGAGGGAGQPGGGAGGGPGATITRTWNESVTTTGEGMSSEISQQYQAVVAITLTKVDVGAWTISGRADVTSSLSSEYESHMTTPLGPCDVHYTDDASGSGSVDVEGGLEAYDGFYQFHVNIQGLEGTNATVRDDSGCNGPNNAETVPWPVAPIVAAGSGNMTGNTLSGSVTEPRTGGEDTTTWSITIDP